MRRLRTATALTALAVLTSLVTTPAMADPGPSRAPWGRTFVKRVGTQLTIGDTGTPWRFAGANDQLLAQSSPEAVGSVLSRARTAGLNVIRVAGSKEIGEQDGASDGYFQYWDGTGPAYNDGDDGLRKLDRVLAVAERSGAKVIIPLVNDWTGYGGMDQYVRWAGGQYHDEFYTNTTIKGWFKDWISHLLNRVNTLTGVAYKNDSTIMAWELADAPRCEGTEDGLPTSPDCTAATITAWADEMSRYIKSVDGRHLLSAGDEGFYCTDPGGPDPTDNCGKGVDTLALAGLPEIDLMSLQLFPDKWGKDAAWGTTWITRHLADSREIGKPVVLSAFGLLNRAVRNPAYKDWTDAFRTGGGAGFAFWQINEEISGQIVPYSDGYTVNCPGPVCLTLGNAASQMRGLAPGPFAPVADDDAATTASQTAVTIDVTANDIAYDATIDPDSIDLDPATEGRQTSFTVLGGTFTTDASGKVVFTPSPGFSGRGPTATYTVRESSEAARVSNSARIRVTVKGGWGR
ncbi:cellulase family glycosylhydrolase [Microbispora sp. NPDC088329]|uniref:cellulase family glycosylhydrolase n=1 Tax=Microbispora sp. NPDC088329 TaxID=3154869 RepID=UPI003435309E